MRMNTRLKARVVALYSASTVEILAGFQDRPDRTMALDALDADGRRVYVTFTDEQAVRLIRTLTGMRDRDWYIRNYRTDGGK